MKQNLFSSQKNPLQSMKGYFKNKVEVTELLISESFDNASLQYGKDTNTICHSWGIIYKIGSFGRGIYTSSEFVFKPTPKWQ